MSSFEEEENAAVVIDNGFVRDVDSYVGEFKHFLRRIKEKYTDWTQNNASIILTQLRKLRTKANEVVRDIDQKTTHIEDELKNCTDNDSSFLHLRAILINFQKLIQTIEQMANKNHKMDHKKDIIFEMIDILMTIFDCINTHHNTITDWICDLLSTIRESTPTVATCSDIEEEATNPTECHMIDFGKELITMVGPETIILDSYPAIEETLQDIVLIVVYEGTFPVGVDSVCGVRIVWKERPFMVGDAEIKRWDKFQSKFPTECSAFIAKFQRSKAAQEIISNRSDVLAIYPSTKKESDGGDGDDDKRVIPVIRVIVKYLGYCPLGEMVLPETVTIDGDVVPLVVEEGYITPCTLASGNGIAYEDAATTGFGTLGGAATDLNGRLFAVTNEHVVNGSRNCLADPLFTNQYFCSPSPGWRRSKLLANLGVPIRTSDGDFVSHIDVQLLNTIPQRQPNDVRNQMTSVCPGFNLITKSGDVTIREIVDFSSYQQVRIGQQIFCINADVDVCVGGVSVSGDIALIEFENVPHLKSTSPMVMTMNDIFQDWNNNVKVDVFKNGAATGGTYGRIARVSHVQGLNLTRPSFKSKQSKVEDSNCQKKRVLFNQLLVHGVGFGSKGDSGSAIIARRGGKFVGLFVGSFGNGLFYCSPAEVLTSNNYSFHLLG